MSTTQELSDAYRKQLIAETEKIKRCIGPKFHQGKTGLAYRKAYWKSWWKIRDKIYPRGKRNLVLKFEGSI
jgi:hypothetical protein